MSNPENENNKQVNLYEIYKPLFVFFFCFFAFFLHDFFFLYISSIQMYRYTCTCVCFCVQLIYVICICFSITLANYCYLDFEILKLIRALNWNSAQGLEMSGPGLELELPYWWISRKIWFEIFFKQCENLNCRDCIYKADVDLLFTILGLYLQSWRESIYL